ncbi:hypothetical protein JoomaDRAFT_2631 [Galbibacter orientalis DSM 19592]|uniref:Uncharacterized protein n=1 Tax=Galbibacter orientalis DSM 19592 TaxID=926559 RepID=I3C7L0_9FLAO|nr:hypothetical protein JoomaDRAFT_2631 [Galbibacter orientalis DSM 19592]
MGQSLHNESSILIYALKAVVLILIAVLSWVFISAIFSFIGIIG